MPQRICSNDPNQFSSFTIWYARGTVDIYPYSDAPLLKLGADIQYLLSIGRTPILVQEFGPDGYQFLETSHLPDYVAKFGEGAIASIPGYGLPVGSITDDGFPTCYPITPSGIGLCPPGYAWDPTTEQCLPLPPPPLVVPLPITPPSPDPRPKIVIPPPEITPPPLGQPDPEGDEITKTLCEQMAANTAALISAINSLRGDGGAGNAACCTAVVNAIAGIEATLIRILTVLPGLAKAGGPPLDIAPVVTELTCICEQLTALASSSGSIPSSLDTGLKSISDAISKAQPTDLQPVVDALDRYTKIIDIKPAVISYLVDQGFIDSNTAQTVDSADTGDWILAAFRTAGWSAVQWFMAGVGYVWDGKAWVVGGDGNIASKALAAAVSTAITAEDTLFLPSVKSAIAALQKLLTPLRVGKLGEQVVDPDGFLTRAVSIIVDVFLVNYAIHIGDLLPGEAMTRLLETLTGLLGLEELRDVQIGPLVQFGPARVAEMRAKFLYRQEMPGINTLATLRARGLLDDADYNGLEGLTGVPPQLAPQIRDAATSGLNARMMLRLVGTGLFSDADAVDELTFAGMRQVSQHRLVLAAAYLGSEPQRGKVRSALEAIYKAGVISDNDFVSRLESVEHNTDRTNLLLEAVQLEKQVVLAKEYEAAYSREFLAGLLDAPGYQAALEGIGMQPPDVAARMFRDETHLNVTTAIQAARQARALQRAEAAAERKAAIEAYRTGTSNEATLTASLLASGLSAVQVAAMVTYQTLAASGVLRWIYGLKLPPSQATLLRQRVADLTRQREIAMLTDAQYVSALTALHIPSNYINALRAGANAHISPKTAAVLTPVVTS